MQTGVVSVTSKVGNLSTKTWSDIWGSTNKSDYNSIPDSQSSYNNTESSYLNNSNRNQETNFKQSSSYSKLGDARKQQQEEDNWNNWDDSQWSNNNNNEKKQQQKSNKSKSNLIDFEREESSPPKVEDKWADDDDNWEPIEQLKPKSKK